MGRKGFVRFPVCLPVKNALGGLWWSPDLLYRGLVFPRACQ